MSHQIITTPLLERLKGIVESHGEEKAVIDDGLTLTYTQLNAAANVLAAELIERNQTVVGLFLQRSIASVIGALACAKAGVTYVPLALDWPESRLERIVERCGITGLLTLPDDAKAYAWAQPLWQGNPMDCITDDVRSQAFVARITPGVPTPLYIMHTSGSTGEPKGVRISHEGIHAIFSRVGRLGYLPGRHMGHGASLTFDMSIMELWGGLLNGCALVITPTETFLDSDLLEAHIRRHDIKLLLMPTSVFNVVSAQNPATFCNLASLCFGGEMPNREAIANVRRACPNLELHNCYGPTECSVVVATESITDASMAGAHIPSGFPLGDDTRFLILDENLQALPPLEEGELAIAGTCVGLGYVRDSNERSPFVKLPGMHNPVYRTGDRAMLGIDGVLTVLGRNDDQIKISGCRIEPGEVCAAVLTSPVVHMAHIGVIKGPNPALIAYIVPVSHAENPAETLRSFLAEQIPDYMIPRHIIILPELPLSSSGKIDASRLPRPVETTTASGDPVLDIFRNVLGDDSFSVEDSFLEAGGSSIMAARLIAALREHSGVAVPFPLIMEPRTAAVAGLYIANAMFNQTNRPENAPDSSGNARSQVIARI